MLKEALQNLDTGFLAEIGLLFFLLAFVLLMIRTLFLVREKGAYAKNLPLQDLEETWQSPSNDSVSNGSA